MPQTMPLVWFIYSFLTLMIAMNFKSNMMNVNFKKKNGLSLQKKIKGMKW